MTSVGSHGESITIVALGPGDVDGLPSTSLEAVRGRTILAPELEPELIALLGAQLVPLPTPEAIPAGAVVAAPDGQAHRLALALPGAATVPSRERLAARAVGAEVARLAGICAHLRRECPWDREQTPASIVPHTIEEAFEVAEAVASGDVPHLVDELGDLLFQTVFQAQFLAEQGDADLASVAFGQSEKLISRHPHVYGDESPATDAEGVRGVWERRKRAERSDEGIFHGLPPGLPALSLAAKVHSRAAGAGFVWPSLAEATAKLHEEIGELEEDPSEREAGDVLFAAVAVARAVGADAELALRRTAQRFRGRVERAVSLAHSEGIRFESLDVQGQLAWYARARAEESAEPG